MIGDYGLLVLPFGGWEVTEWMAERLGDRENAKLKPTEGRRSLGIGQESHDEVRPSEIANALPRMAICFLVGEGTGRRCVMVGVVRTPGVVSRFWSVGW